MPEFSSLGLKPVEGEKRVKQKTTCYAGPAMQVAGRRLANDSGRPQALILTAQRVVLIIRFL
jgi:hypothetical protein